ncbi:hypothetical protein [Streptomyces sp. NBC_01304]|uniref:hypothetical protein n=1 Tax=Streptomyces sp. NBC_01304 TaxID=2903818 RepID=UPI002E104781|nr:hypothetical protein OG430_01685 [Streptomyces sp. NBC_01304]
MLPKAAHLRALFIVALGRTACALSGTWVDEVGGVAMSGFAELDGELVGVVRSEARRVCHAAACAVTA